MKLFDSTPVTTFAQLSKTVAKSKIHHDLALIERAYQFAEQQHQGQLRKSGEPFIIHPLTVAAFVVRLELDTVSVAAALLHDVLEDGTVDLDTLDKEFGTEIAYIVDGLTNIKKQATQFAEQDESVQELQHLIIKAAGDVRVLIIRMADKLHNALTMKYLSEGAQQRFAKSLHNIFAPLADYLGLGYFKKELDDIAFSVLQPKEYQLVKQQFETTRANREQEILEMQQELKKMLKKYSIADAKIYGRAKGLHSSYRKLKKYMLRRKITDTTEAININQLFDTVALSIITESVEQCYIVLGLINSKWDQVPDEFDDYIARPKDNGYSAIHIAVLVNEKPVEIQIKTQQMHDHNEFGPASHIAYKLTGGSNKTGLNFSWVRSLVRWQDADHLQAEDYKVNTFANSIFVFTPKGLVKRLDVDATPLDFAFSVHTELGVQYAGAKANDKMVDMKTKLRTGDIVEILTNKKQKYAKADWLKCANMSSTRARIRKSLREQQDQEGVRL